MHSMRILTGSSAASACAAVLLGALAVCPAARAADDISVTQSAPGYVAGAKLVVECTIAYTPGRQVQSLLWTPSLPVGWSLDATDGAVIGHGTPSVDPDGFSVIFLSANLSANNPIVFQYTVNVPSGEIGERTLNGILEYQLDGMPNPADVTPLAPLLLKDAEAVHETLGYLAGTPMTVTCTFSHPAGVELQSLLWHPVLPSAAWKLVSAATVSTDFAPAVDPDGEAIVLLGDIHANPLSFTYTVLVPAGVTGVQELRGEVEYQLAGMPNPAITWAEPDPLILKPMHTLEIISPYGTPAPGVGLYTNFYGTVLTNLNSATATVGDHTYACAGWLLTSNAPTTGNGTTCEMTLTNNAILSWIWVAPQVSDRTVVELETLAFQAEVAYTNAGFAPLNLLYSLDTASAAAGMTLSSTGAFAWTPSEEQGDAAYTVTVTVTDNGAAPHWLIASETFTIAVVETNRPPALVAIADQLADEHSTLTFTASASDPDLPEQTLTFTLDAASLAAGMTIDPLTGVFSWSPTPGQAAAGSYTVTVIVTDDGLNPAALSDSKSFIIGVVDSRATHETFGYLAGRTAEIFCTFEHPTDKTLLSLLWRPLLPTGWELISASGQAVPEVDPLDGVIVFLGYSTLNTPNPLTFSYIVSVPDGLTGPQELRAEADYLLVDMANPRTIPVNPDPLILSELHTYEIVSAEGQCLPVVGVYTNLHGTNLSATVDTPLTVGTRTFACTGWTLAETNLPPVSGATDYVAWVLTNDVILTWHWVSPLIAPANSVDVSMDEDGLWTPPSITASEPYRPGLVSQLAWSRLVAPTGGIATVSGTGASPTIVYTPTTNWYGSDSFVVQVADLLGGFDQITVNVSVEPVNDPPVLALIGAQQTDEFTPLTFTAVATDVDIPAQTLTFSISGAPPNATFDSGTGVFTWVPTAGQAGTEGAVYTVTVTVTDNGTSPDNQSDSETFTLTLLPVRANHTTIGYIPGQLLAINCEFTYPASRDLQSLLWRPELPAGWTLESASGEGSPSVDPDGEAIILLGNSLSSNPLSFTYTVRVPADATGTNAIGGLIEYQLNNMSNPGEVRAQPDPLIIPMLLMLPELTFNDRDYDGTTNATVVNYGALAGVMLGHDVMLVTTGAFAAFGTKLVGADKLVTLNGLLLTGADAAWYAIGIQTNTATINPLLLTVTGTFAAEDKVYDGLTNAAIVAASALTLTTSVVGDDVTFVPVVFFDTPGVGDDKTVSLSVSSTLAGTDAGNYILSFENAPTGLADILFPEVSAMQDCLIHFKSPSEGLCTISNTLVYPADSSVATLAWKPHLLYPGWTVHTVQGDGSPVTDGTNIVFNNLGAAARPLVFTCTFKVPPGTPITNLLDATVTFALEGVAGTLEMPAQPTLLLKRYHSADYQTWTSAFEDPIMIPDWKIDPDEAQRFNEYMRSGEAKYHGTVVTSDTPDGFDIGWTDDNSWYHSSDYQTWISGFDDPIMVPNLKFDVDEAQQLLNYVRDAEGAYHITNVTPDTPNGYGSGTE